MSTTNEPTTGTLAEFLDRGGDVRTLAGYHLLVANVLPMLPSNEEQRAEQIAFYQWDPLGHAEIEPGQPFGGWADVADYRAFNRYATELVSDDDIAERFIAALPQADRKDVERMRFEQDQPRYQIQSGPPFEVGIVCGTCDAEIDFDGPHRTGYALFGERHETDLTAVCVDCIRLAVPHGWQVIPKPDPASVPGVHTANDGQEANR